MEAPTLRNVERMYALYSPAPQSGKTTAASMIANDFYYGRGQRMSFAFGIRSMLGELLKCAGYSREDVQKYLYVEKEVPIAPFGKTVRQMLQTLGTEWGRNLVDRDIWANLAIHRAVEMQGYGMVPVFDDMRFMNEFEKVKDAGGITIFLTRPGYVRQHGHPSDGELDDMRPWFDYQVEASNLLELHNEILSVVWKVDGL